jgi:hypothetical protein
MRFVLTYSGALPANGGPQEKHRIRRALLPQLREQWNIDPGLSVIARSADNGVTKLDQIANKFTLGGFRFVPLVMRQYNLVCYLEIVLLRREEPGAILQSGGDIDNRLKTLFDSLSMPIRPNQLRAVAPQRGEDPFYCLLEDDSLVAGFKITTERLLEPLVNHTDVRLTITATVRPTKVAIQNLGFLGGWL